MHVPAPGKQTRPAELLTKYKQNLEWIVEGERVNINHDCEISCNSEDCILDYCVCIYVEEVMTGHQTKSAMMEESQLYMRYERI